MSANPDDVSGRTSDIRPGAFVRRRGLVSFRALARAPAWPPFAISRHGPGFLRSSWTSAFLKPHSRHGGFIPSPKRHASRSKMLRLPLLALVLLAAVSATASLALAQSPQGPVDPAPTGEETESGAGQQSAGATAMGDPPDARNVEKFMDELVPRQLEEGKIPGATVSVVKDGEVVFAKGYGEADVEANKSVVADETLFRIASTTKLFTATAVMQLVEEEKVDLDRDVNAYLDDVEIPDTYPGQPVTLRHLLTHTAGFEESFTGSLARTEDDMIPLGEYLSGNTPARVRPPGEATSYSNYGMSLAGHVVEEVSETPYDRYLEENVFDTLGMESTTSAQPPAPALEERLATGYDVGGAGPVAGSFEYIDDAPAGSASTTSADMARFMISHLNNGSYNGTRILEADTAQEMREKQFVNAPGLQDGMGLGFSEQTINGERTIQHAGNLIRFHALLTLIPERDVGVFVAYNSYGQGGDFAEYELTDAFFDRFYPEEKQPAPLRPSAADVAENAERFAGSYRITRSNGSGFEKVSTLMTGARVAANPDGSLTTRGGLLSRDFEKTERRWIRIAPADSPATFRAVDGDERIAFRHAGSTTYLASDADPTSAYGKLPFYEAPRLHLGLLAGGAAVLLLSAVAWAVAATISWWRYRKLRDNVADKRKVRRAGRRARLLASVVALLVPLFVVGMANVLSNVETALGYGASPLMIGVLTLPVLISVLTLSLLVYTALAWSRGYWGLFGRLHYSLVALSALTIVSLSGYYNLIGYQF